MNKFFFLLFMSLAPIVVAQDLSVSITKGEIFRDEKKNMELVYAEDDGNGGHISVRAYFGGVIPMLQGYYVDRFDSELNRTQQQEIEMKMMSRDPGFIRGMSVHEGKVNLIFLRYDGKSKEVYYSVMSASVDDFNFTERRILTFDKKEFSQKTLVDMMYETSPFEIKNKLGGYVGFSENKNFAALSLRLKTAEGSKIKIFVFDKNFDLYYEHYVEGTGGSEIYEFNDFQLVDDDGSCYYLTKAFTKEKDQRKGRLAYHYEIGKIGKDKNVRLSRMEANDHFVGSLSLLYKYNQLVCVGYYSDLGNDWYKGVARFDVDPNSLDVLNRAIQPFSEQFILDKFGQTKYNEIGNVKLKAFVMDPNGDITMNSETTYVVKTMKAKSMHVVKSVYHFNDIMSAKISASGDLLWARNINKQQSGNGKAVGYYSYTSTAKDGKVYFLINSKDDVKMLRKDRIEFSEIGRNRANLFLIAIDENGDFSYNKIIDDRESDLSYLTINGVVSKDGSEIILSGIDGKDKQLLKLTF